MIKEIKTCTPRTHTQYLQEQNNSKIKLMLFFLPEQNYSNGLNVKVPHKDLSRTGLKPSIKY